MATISGNRTTAAYLLALLCLGIMPTQGKPSHQPLDPVDVCIFTCDYCYKGMFLVKCANECLAQDGEVSGMWHRECPFFGKPIYFD